MAKRPERSPYLGGGSFGEVPKWNHGNVLGEIGSSGLRAFSGYLREEFVTNLIGRQAATVYREMLDNSPIIGAVMFAIEGAMRKAEWRVLPGDSKATDKEIEFVESLRSDMEQSWEEFVVEALSMLGYGYSVHELVYKRRTGPKSFGSKIASSNYDDGLIGWRKLPIRSQDTILKWFFDATGQILGLTQQPWLGPLIDLPAEKFILFRPKSHKGNPEGRALDPETPIPTPDGWRIMDDLHPGDKVFDENGRIRYVTARADWQDRPCYRVEFDDGSTIVADANHQWVTRSLYERGKERPAKVRTTADIAATVKTSIGSSNHSVEWAAALDYPAQILPVDPYFLGLWLGDGTSRTSDIACHADDAEETVALIEACGYKARVEQNGATNSFGRAIKVYGDEKWDRQGPASLLTALGLRGNKHIPQAYLRGSKEQRHALLAGLMDSDGHADDYGRCEFVNTNTGLVYGVAELVRSLGCSASVGLRKRANGVDHKQDAFACRFRPIWTPFRLARKAAKVRQGRARDRHYIVSVEAVENRRTVCIEVDSPSHLFLAGESMVPTHNSVIRNAYRPYWFVKRLEEFEAIRLERMAGNVIVRVPNGLLDAAQAGDAGAIATLNAYKLMATRAKTDEQMGLVLPSDVYPSMDGKLTTSRMFDYEYITPAGGSASIGANEPIVRHKLDMLTATLTDFISMGHTNRGAQNLAETKVDLFLGSVEGWLNSMSGVINTVALPRLWALNGFDRERMPIIVPDMAQRTDLDTLGGFILALSQSGVQMFPDEDLEAYVRDAAGLPDAVEGKPWAVKQIEDVGGADPTNAAKAIVDGLMSNQLRTRKRRA